MEKNSKIIELIAQLKLEPNFNQIEIVDYWDADLCAIGLKKEERLIYISTFNYDEITESKYDCDFELLNKNDFEKIETVMSKKGISMNELKNEMRKFFKI